MFFLLYFPKKLSPTYFWITNFVPHQINPKQCSTPPKSPIPSRYPALRMSDPFRTKTELQRITRNEQKVTSKLYWFYLELLTHGMP